MTQNWGHTNQKAAYSKTGGYAHVEGIARNLPAIENRQITNSTGAN
jgi:hypothetical protein